MNKAEAVQILELIKNDTVYFKHNQNKIEEINQAIKTVLKENEKLNSLVDTVVEKLKRDKEELQEQANKLKFDSLEDKTIYFYTKELLKMVEVN